MSVAWGDGMTKDLTLLLFFLCHPLFLKAFDNPCLQTQGFQTFLVLLIEKNSV